MAGAGARVAERLARDRDKLPRITVGVERELQHARRAGITSLAVRPDSAERADFGAPGADDELADARHRIGDARGCLGREALVEGVVGVDDDVHAGGVQGLPQRAHCQVGVVFRVEEGMVPVRDGAPRRMGGEVGAQPLLLGRPGSHGDRRAAAVQYHHVPGAEVVAVITLRRIAGRGAEVAEVPRRAGGLVVAVARRRLRARLVPAPARHVARAVLGDGAVVVGGVAEREHGPGDTVEKCRGGVVVRDATFGDVARAHECYRPGRRCGEARAGG